MPVVLKKMILMWMVVLIGLGLFYKYPLKCHTRDLSKHNVNSMQRRTSIRVFWKAVTAEANQCGANKGVVRLA